MNFKKVIIVLFTMTVLHAQIIFADTTPNGEHKLMNNQRASSQVVPKGAELAVSSLALSSGPVEIKAPGDNENQTSICSSHYAAEEVSKGKRFAITGTALFFTGLLFRYLALEPMCIVASSSVNALDPTSKTLVALAEYALPSRMIGVSLAYAGATHSYDAFHDCIDGTSPEPFIGKLYVVGLIVGLAGMSTGVSGVLSNNNAAQWVGSGLEFAQDITWAWATLWALTYTSKNKAIAHRKGIVLCPTYQGSHYGLNLSMEL